MSRTSIDLDDAALERVMTRYHLSTKRDAVNFALRTLAAEHLSVEQARSIRGSGWDWNLEQMREVTATRVRSSPAPRG